MIIEILGLVFEIILGTIGHFLYKNSNYNRLVGFLFSKNESVYEHMKLGITPIIMWTIIELLTKRLNNLFFAKFSSIITFSFSLLILYYTYKFILKKNIIAIDILIFYISLFLSTIVSMNIINLNSLLVLNFLSFFGLCFIVFLYFKFNKNTPNWFIFKDF